MYYELISPILFFNFLTVFIGFFLYWGKVEGDQELDNNCKLFDGDTFGFFTNLCGEQLWMTQYDMSVTAVLIGLQVLTSMSAFVYTFWFQRPTREFINIIMIQITFPMISGGIGIIWYESSTENFKYNDLINYSFTIGPVLAMTSAIINLLMILLMVFEKIK